MTEFRKGKRDGPLCEYCGNSGHGKSPEEKTRRKECPAYSQFCGKCRAKSHFKSTASVRATTGQNSDESSSSESSSEGFVGTVNSTGQFCGLTATSRDGDEGQAMGDEFGMFL